MIAQNLLFIIINLDQDLSSSSNSVYIYIYIYIYACLFLDSCLTWLNKIDFCRINVEGAWHCSVLKTWQPTFTKIWYILPPTFQSGTELFSTRLSPKDGWRSLDRAPSACRSRLSSKLRGAEKLYTMCSGPEWFGKLPTSYYKSS